MEELDLCAPCSADDTSKEDNETGRDSPLISAFEWDPILSALYTPSDDANSFKFAKANDSEGKKNDNFLMSFAS